MKYSIYNTVLPLSEKLGLVYCGATDRFVVYRRGLTQLLETASADRLAVEAPGLYAELVRGGAIVPDEEDEFGNLKRLGDEAERSPKSYRLILNPTIDCNFKCWYCYEDHIAGSKMGPETLRRVSWTVSRSWRRSICRFSGASRCSITTGSCAPFSTIAGGSAGVAACVCWWVSPPTAI